MRMGSKSDYSVSEELSELNNLADKYRVEVSKPYSSYNTYKKKTGSLRNGVAGKISGISNTKS